MGGGMKMKMVIAVAAVVALAMTSSSSAEETPAECLNRCIGKCNDLRGGLCSFNCAIGCHWLFAQPTGEVLVSTQGNHGVGGDDAAATQAAFALHNNQTTTAPLSNQTAAVAHISEGLTTPEDPINQTALLLNDTDNLGLTTPEDRINHTALLLNDTDNLGLTTLEDRINQTALLLNDTDDLGLTTPQNPINQTALLLNETADIDQELTTPQNPINHTSSLLNETDNQGSTTPPITTPQNPTIYDSLS